MPQYKPGDKFIIEIQSVIQENPALYRIKGFKALVFDESGLNRLELPEESKEPEIYPCPFCGSEPYTEHTSDNTKFWVACINECGACGPIMPQESEAVHEWNRMARAMQREEESQ